MTAMASLDVLSTEECGAVVELGSMWQPLAEQVGKGLAKVGTDASNVASLNLR